MFNVTDRENVLPGQLIGSSVRYDRNCFEEDGQIYSLVSGMVRVNDDSVSVLPKSGGYMPKRGDTVLGIVVDTNSAGWVVDIGSPYRCFMRKEDDRGGRGGRGGRDNRGGRGGYDRRPSRPQSFNVGDIVSAKIQSVDEVYDTLLERPWGLNDGLIVEVNPKIVPRLIGRKQSMLNMIKEKTYSKIVTGQNGLVWIKGENNTLVVEAVKKIEREAQSQGLTDRISQMLDGAVKLNSRVDEK